MSRRPTTPVRRPAESEAAAGKPVEPRKAPASRGLAAPRTSAGTRSSTATGKPAGARKPAAPRRPAPSSAPARTPPSGSPPAPTGSPAPSALRQRAVVSATSVRRFAARARAARRTALRPFLGALAGLALLAAAAWVVLGSPLLTLRAVEVVGTERVPAQQVAAMGDPQLGTPLARVDTGALRSEVEQLPMVREAEVVRVWPRAVEVRVVERVPLAAVPQPGGRGGFDVVDAEGVVVAQASEPPPDLPLVQVDVASAGADALRETTDVLTRLPHDIRAQVASAGATSRDSVRLDLRSGAQVVWGSADDPAMKAEVLRVLLATPAAVYDVSSPTTPVTR